MPQNIAEHVSESLGDYGGGGENMVPKGRRARKVHKDCKDCKAHKGCQGRKASEELRAHSGFRAARTILNPMRGQPLQDRKESKVFLVRRAFPALPALREFKAPKASKASKDQPGRRVSGGLPDRRAYRRF